MVIEVDSEDKTKKLGENIGRQLQGGNVIELIGDVGAGKTTLTKGIALGLGVKDNVLSPSFTICQQYQCRDGLTLAHYDFYRLTDVGIMSEEMSESIGKKDVVTIIEWGEIVESILPENKITIRIISLDDNSRRIDISRDLELNL